MENTKIRQRFDSLRSDRKTVEQTWQWIERYVVPFRGKFFRPQTSEHEIEWRQRLIYDSTAIEACQILANSIQGGLLSPAIMWFKLKFRDSALNDDQEAAAWLEDCGKRLWQALLDSNFNLEANELMLDLASFGTGVVVEETEGEDPTTFQGLNFQAVPIREAFFEEDHRGQILRFYRLLQWKPLQIVDKFGDKVPESIKAKLESSNTDEKIDIVFCIYEREDKKGADLSKPLSAENRPFGFKYILHSSAELLGEEGGYYEMPAFLPRWQKVSGSQWGHSPSHLALSNILSLNHSWDLFFASWEKSIDPVQLSERRNIYGDFNHEAGSVNTVRDIERIKEMVPNIRMDVETFGVESLRQMIRGCFHVNELQLKDSPAMTATEVRARIDLMNRLFGPTMGRLQNDFLDRMLQRSFNILWRAQQFRKPPQSVVEAGRNGQLDIEYQGPLSRSEKVEEVAASEGFVANAIATAGAAAQAGSTKAAEALDWINFDEVLKDQHQSRQVSPRLLNSKDKVEADRKQREEAIARQAALQEAAGAGQAMQEMGKGSVAIDEASGSNVSRLPR